MENQTCQFIRIGRAILIALAKANDSFEDDYRMHLAHKPFDILIIERKHHALVQCPAYKLVFVRRDSEFLATNLQAVVTTFGSEPEYRTGLDDIEFPKQWLARRQRLGDRHPNE